VETDSTSATTPPLPSFITEPLPKARSIWLTRGLQRLLLVAVVLVVLARKPHHLPHHRSFSRLADSSLAGSPGRKLIWSRFVLFRKCSGSGLRRNRT
jgi:hypothetical protein